MKNKTASVHEASSEPGSCWSNSKERGMGFLEGRGKRKENLRKLKRRLTSQKVGGEKKKAVSSRK